MKKNKNGSSRVIGIQTLFDRHGILNSVDLTLMYSLQRYLHREISYTWLNFPDLEALNKGLWEILVDGTWYKGHPDEQTVVMFLGERYEQSRERHIEILRILNRYLTKGLKVLIVTESGYENFEEKYTWFKRVPLIKTGHFAYADDFDLYPGHSKWDQWEAALDKLLPDLQRARS